MEYARKELVVIDHMLHAAKRDFFVKKLKGMAGEIPSNISMFMDLSGVTVKLTADCDFMLRNMDGFTKELNPFPTIGSVLKSLKETDADTFYDVALRARAELYLAENEETRMLLKRGYFDVTI